MSRYLIAYAGAPVVPLARDFLWLGLIMRGFYKSALGEFGRFYIVYVVGVAIFATAPALE